MNEQIASAAEEQGAVSEEINRNVVEISSVADQTATGANEVTSSVGELMNMANSLQRAVANFKVDRKSVVEGKSVDLGCRRIIKKKIKCQR